MILFFYGIQFFVIETSQHTCKPISLLEIHQSKPFYARQLADSYNENDISKGKTRMISTRMALSRPKAPLIEKTKASCSHHVSLIILLLCMRRRIKPGAHEISGKYRCFQALLPYHTQRSILWYDTTIVFQERSLFVDRPIYHDGQSSSSFTLCRGPAVATYANTSVTTASNSTSQKNTPAVTTPAATHIRASNNNANDGTCPLDGHNARQWVRTLEFLDTEFQDAPFGLFGSHGQCRGCRRSGRARFAG